jgi:carbonic anhydrase
MENYKKLLLANKAWVQDRLALSPHYFSRLADEQTPEYLWIGCSDSRVPAESITGAEAGELFVHRNIANQVSHTDFNLLSVLQFAVDVLQVKHIIVCGHYGCGGIKNAISNKNLGLIDHWLCNIKDTYSLHEQELENIKDEELRVRRMVELNVEAQLWHLAEFSIIQMAWKKENRPYLHGWTYDLHTGYLNELLTIDANTEIPDIYKFKF